MGQGSGVSSYLNHHPCVPCLLFLCLLGLGFGSGFLPHYSTVEDALLPYERINLGASCLNIWFIVPSTRFDQEFWYCRLFLPTTGLGIFGSLLCQFCHLDACCIVKKSNWLRYPFPSWLVSCGSILQYHDRKHACNVLVDVSIPLIKWVLQQ